MTLTTTITAGTRIMSVTSSALRSTAIAVVRSSASRAAHQCSLMEWVGQSLLKCVLERPPGTRNRQPGAASRLGRGHWRRLYLVRRTGQRRRVIYRTHRGRRGGIAVEAWVVRVEWADGLRAWSSASVILDPLGGNPSPGSSGSDLGRRAITVPCSSALSCCGDGGLIPCPDRQYHCSDRTPLEELPWPAYPQSTANGNPLPSPHPKCVTIARRPTANTGRSSLWRISTGNCGAGNRGAEPYADPLPQLTSRCS